nr:MAG TPA: hypothetical protein [Caudoviricetes sp.]
MSMGFFHLPSGGLYHSIDFLSSLWYNDVGGYRYGKIL